MKAPARKTKSKQSTKPQPIANVWLVPMGAPMGYCELRSNGRKLASVRSVNHYKSGKTTLNDWEYTIFGKSGAAMTTGKRDSELAAKEAALAIVERLNQAGMV
jgi:hypothetical protein